MYKKIVIPIVLVIFTLIIFLPPIIYGYIYPNNSDDTALHIRLFEAIQQSGNSGVIQYWGQNIVGYPLVWFSNLTHISVSLLFMWFNFIVLWLVGMMTFLLLKTINWQSGLIGMFIVTFCTSSTLNLFDTGAIYDLATVGVIAPFFLLCVVKFIGNKKWWWAFLAVILLVFSIMFHSMVIMYIIGAKTVEPIPSIIAYAFTLLGEMMTIFGILGIFILIYKNRSIKLDSKNITLLVGFILLIVGLSVCAFTALTSYPYRFAIDLAIVSSLFIAFLWGLVLKNLKYKYLLVIIAVIVLLGSYSNINTYFHNNSAIKEADKQAIAYLNTLDGKYFSCSPQIAAWLYERYTDKRYKKDTLPYISRNEPMTYKTTEGSPYYWSMPAYKISSEIKTENYKIFTDNELVVIVYREDSE
jgi:hypothetical protein